MSVTTQTATVFGGTGFVGRQVVRELAKRGVRIKVATRVPARAYFLRPYGAVGQIVPLGCDYNDPESLAAAVKGSEYVVNCVGILTERRKRQFQKVHEELAGNIAAACSKEGVESFVHVSALGCEKGKSRYAKSKLAGERAVTKNFPAATILRPSVIFGDGDEFFNMFARMVSLLPSFIPMPLVGGGKTKFQPVFVGDVADAVVRALESKRAQGKIYELGGPEVVSFREVYDILFQEIDQRQSLMKIGFFPAKVMAFFMGVLPDPPLTRDQVDSLKTDSVVSTGAPGLEALGVHSTAMDIILPTYLVRYRLGGRFAKLGMSEA